MKESTFDKYYESLNDYLRLNNDRYPPSYGGFHNGLYIGSWAQKIRNIYINGKMQFDGSIKYKGSTLTKEQINKLNSINFKWVVRYDILYKKEFNKNINYETIQRYLTEELNRLLNEYEDKNLTKENLEKITSEYRLILNKRN